MKRTDMVRNGAEQLIVAENTIESAICEVAELVSKLGRMRMDSNLSAVIGQEAMDGLAETFASLSSARGAIVRVHGHLDTVKTQIGCGAMAVGTGDDKPGTGKQPTGRHIQVVAQAAENRVA